MFSVIARVRSLPGGLARSNSAVRIGPGPTALAVIPRGPSSRAQTRVMPISPALVAA